MRGSVIEVNAGRRGRSARFDEWRELAFRSTNVPMRAVYRRDSAPLKLVCCLSSWHQFQLLRWRILFFPSSVFFFFRTRRSNPFPSISGLEACHRRSPDQYLPSLNRRIIHLSGLATEALNCDINLGLSSTIWEGHISKQSLLYCTPKGRIKQSITSLLHTRCTMLFTVSPESILWNEISDLISCNSTFCSAGIY